MLGKFLAARDKKRDGPEQFEKNLDEAARMLKASLIWRRQVNPRTFMDVLHPTKFERLGYITTHQRQDGGRQVVTWNLWHSKADARSQKSITADQEG